MSVASLVGSIDDLPSLPTVYTKAQSLIRDPRTGASDVGAVVAEDQGLTARLLRVVNSPIYGFPQRIDTISRAITIIGFRQLSELLLATSVLHAFQGWPKGSEFDMEQFWKHSLATALVSRTVATYMRSDNVERFFVAGLIHDIGRLVLLSASSERYLTVFRKVSEETVPTVDAEKRVYGFTHADVGGEVVRRWGLPESLSEAVQHHHRPVRARIDPEAAAIVHIADIVAHSLGIGRSGMPYVPQLDDRSWQRTGLAIGHLEPIVERSTEQMAAAMALLN